jgi:hypothetical protein
MVATGPKREKGSEMKVQTRTSLALFGGIAALVIAVGGVGIGLAATTSADPNPAGTAPNPFGALNCICSLSPVDVPTWTEVQRGIRDGLSISVPRQ